MVAALEGVLFEAEQACPTRGIQSGILRGQTGFESGGDRFEFGAGRVRDVIVQVEELKETGGKKEDGEANHHFHHDREQFFLPEAKIASFPILRRLGLKLLMHRLRLYCWRVGGNIDSLRIKERLLVRCILDAIIVRY